MAIMQHKPNRIEDAVERLTPMIAKMAHKYARNHKSRDLDDLIQDGMEGLMKAYHSYDATKGRAFSSHAYQWVWAHIKDRAMGKWNDYNNTAPMAYEDYDLGAYDMPLDEKIDYDRIIEGLDNTTRAIVVARRNGYNYRQIAEAMESLGRPMTLHQVRNKYLEVFGQE